MVIDARSIHKSYTLRKGLVRVLQGADLTVGEGEAVAIVGVSGAGKSTLLHILGGLDHPESGAVIFRGQDLYRLSEYQRARLRARQIGFVFQSYHLLPEMDVLENVMLPAMATGGLLTSGAAARRRAMDLLDAVGLSARGEHTPLELSGGEQQRVALARALMNDPPLVLADEPTGNLDDGTGAQVLERLFALTRARGHTLILVTHDERIAARCDRVLKLAEGALARHNGR
ncbi:MAG: ABC transporter ATP-binding protein [Verrucomicrobiota bacterium]|nr:ABC transporter ATP-binding protein [Verrucomicrobiota bacterium]